MQKTILITGSSDGIGLEAAKMLCQQGHKVLIHGRNKDKLKAVENELCSLAGLDSIDSFVCDLSDMDQVKNFAQNVLSDQQHIDVIINNAGILKTPETITKDGIDIRFSVNTIAPYLLTQQLLPLLDTSSRVINVSSAAQDSVNLDAMAGRILLKEDMAAYAQSKLAIIMWTNHLAQLHKDSGPLFISVNPGSLLATKMVKEGFGIEGKDLRIGADILCRLSLNEEFKDATGLYFDNDIGELGAPHKDALDSPKSLLIVEAIEEILNQISRQ